MCDTSEFPPPPHTCQWSLNAFHRVYLPPPDSGFDTGLLEQVKALELRGVSAAEAGDLQGALQLFSQAIEILPQRASAYNNRAQALRLRGDAAGTAAADSPVNHSQQHGVRHIRLSRPESSVTPHQAGPCQTLGAGVMMMQLLIVVSRVVNVERILTVAVKELEV